MSARTQAGVLAGHRLVEALIENGADMAFGVPGESFLAALDGFAQHADRIRFITCRQEGGAANMADAYGKLTGRPGIAFCTRGPGATNGSIGLHTALQDSTPMILFIGQIPRDVTDRGAFQEVDYRRMFGQVAKWVAQIDHADRIPEYVARAFRTATSGRMGPVVLALPEDMLEERTDAPVLPRQAPPSCWPEPARMREMAERLARAERPLAIVGGTGWTPTACGRFERFARAMQLPVVCEYRFQDVFDNYHDHYAGELGPTMSPALAERIRDADVILAAGLRLAEGTTRGYRLIEAPRPRQSLIHVHPGAEELGSVFHADLPILADMPAFCEMLGDLPGPAADRSAHVAALHRAYLDHVGMPSPPAATMDLPRIVQAMADRLPADAIVTEGAGNFAGWWQRYFRHHGQAHGARTQLAPGSGAMGYGVPSAVAAQLCHPGRRVVSVSGDGCFLMNGQELATAVQYELPIVFLVVNNGLYGTIRAHQEMHFPGRYVGTSLRNPDFAALARAYGADGHTVERTEAFDAVFARALASGRTSLIEIRSEPDIISTRTTLTALRAVAAAPR